MIAANAALGPAKKPCPQSTCGGNGIEGATSRLVRRIVVRAG
jgi:hypothetical protein